MWNNELWPQLVFCLFLKNMKFFKNLDSKLHSKIESQLNKYISAPLLALFSYHYPLMQVLLVCSSLNPAGFCSFFKQTPSLCPASDHLSLAAWRSERWVTERKGCSSCVDWSSGPALDLLKRRECPFWRTKEYSLWRCHQINPHNLEHDSSPALC